MSLLARMVREEWRLHTSLFGPRRFLAFPVAIAALVAAGTYLLDLTGTTPPETIAGLHGLIVFFGLQVGTVSLMGRDALRDVLGDITPLVFTARTLPVSWRTLLGTFLVKDLLFYAGLALIPVVVGWGAVAAAGGTPLGAVALAFLTVSLCFGLGSATSVSMAAVGTRQPLLLLAALVAAGVAFVWTGTNPLAVTPYALYADPSPVTLAIAVVPTLVLGTIGVALFEPVETGHDGRQRIAERLLLPLTPDALSQRPMLTVTRSSGSVGKVLFSMGVLFAVTALVLQQVARATNIEPGAGLAFGTLLGLGAFTTYSWVTRFDEQREYLRYPISMGRVFRGKGRAYAVLSVGAGLPYLALAAAWYPVEQLAVGVVVMPLVAAYVFGLSAYVTGLAASELLFDTARFAVFGAALSAVATPLLVAALARQADPLLATAGGLAIAAVAGGIGLVLARLAGPKWDDALRA